MRHGLSPKRHFLSLCCLAWALPAQGFSFEFCLACLPISSAAAPQLGSRLQDQVNIPNALARHRILRGVPSSGGNDAGAAAGGAAAL